MIQTIANTLLDWAARLDALAVKIVALTHPASVDLTPITDAAVKVEASMQALEAAVAAAMAPPAA